MPGSAEEYEDIQVGCGSILYLVPQNIEYLNVKKHSWGPPVDKKKTTSLLVKFAKMA